jgi:hypothetical protein
MKRTPRVFATCIGAGAAVALIVWLTWNLPWQGLGLGFLTGLIFYANMTRPPKSKLDKEKEVVIHGMDGPQ